jgi:hypothetical protein
LFWENNRGVRGDFVAGGRKFSLIPSLRRREIDWGEYIEGESAATRLRAPVGSYLFPPDRPRDICGDSRE